MKKSLYIILFFFYIVGISDNNSGADFLKNKVCRFLYLKPIEGKEKNNGK